MSSSSTAGVSVGLENHDVGAGWFACFMSHTRLLKSRYSATWAYLSSGVFSLYSLSWAVVSSRNVSWRDN